MQIAEFPNWYTPITETGCWLWLGGLLHNGYGAVKINGRPRRAHRVSWELAHGTIPDDLQILHKCDVRSCVNPDHLFLGSQLDNMHDMIAKGRKVSSPGERNGQARISVDQVRAIRADKRTQDVIAAAFGILQSLVSQIKLRKVWSHVGD